MKKHLIFKCLNCGHNIYTSKPKKLLGYNCPNCGEDRDGNYALIGEGVFEE